MEQTFIDAVAEAIRARGFELAPGLTNEELDAAEAAHAFRFPPDLRYFLKHALPLGGGFPDWRCPDSEQIRGQLSWPADGICFDIEHDAFWYPSWGPRPESLDAARETARQAVRSAPFLIPVFAHRYLPADPCEPGNPVFSVYQTDIIYYGFDLPSYLAAEFKVDNLYPTPEAPAEIDLWSELVRLNG